MGKIRLTKIFHFETSHALYGYDGKCKNIHGHSYSLYVTVIGKPIENVEHPKNGMVMDFGDLKAIVNEQIVTPFDHALLLNKNTPHRLLGEELMAKDHHVILLDYQPTCENMLLDFVKKLDTALPQNIELIALKLNETKSSYSEWMKSDQ